MARLKFVFGALARMQWGIEMWKFAFSTHATINHIKDKTLLMKKVFFLWRGHEAPRPGLVKGIHFILKSQYGFFEAFLKASGTSMDEIQLKFTELNKKKPKAKKKRTDCGKPRIKPSLLYLFLS